MPVRLLLRRLGYRVAYRALQVIWLLVHFPRRGVKCVVTDGDLVLLVRHTYGRRCWDLPGGNLRRDEPAVAAARREMSEELGITGANWVALGQLRRHGGHSRDTLHCFGAELCAPKLTLDLGEIAEARWFQRGRLPSDLSHYVRPILALLPVSVG
ncbi:MAG: NUDIX domain-containing protein [Solirubrobacteraceae bacterium]